jgi:ABC-type multidrug transport system ATPase subunit
VQSWPGVPRRQIIKVQELLTVAGLTKCFGNRCVLDDVTFPVRAGEILGLIGPNGAGKTTLFECVAVLLPASAGTIRFQKRELKPSCRKSALFYLPEGS